MCLIAFAWKVHPLLPLVLLANRDEAHERPTLPLAEWPDTPGVYGGRDQTAGGTWLALNSNRRLAAVTNFREPPRNATLRSRGALVADFVRGRAPVTELQKVIEAEGEQYGPFNLLAWDGNELLYAANRPRPQSHRLSPGLYALSNGALDAPWPKATRLRDVLANWIATRPASPEPLWTALGDRSGFPDAELPRTGIDIELERRLAPAFIVGELYGTRASSLLKIGVAEACFEERGFGPNGRPLGGRTLNIEFS